MFHTFALHLKCVEHFPKASTTHPEQQQQQLTDAGDEVSEFVQLFPHPSQAGASENPIHVGAEALTRQLAAPVVVLAAPLVFTFRTGRLLTPGFL